MSGFHINGILNNEELGFESTTFFNETNQVEKMFCDMGKYHESTLALLKQMHYWHLLFERNVDGF